MSATQIHTTVDFARPGKQHGHLAIPYSHNLGGWANLHVPITVVANGDGPTALVMAGNHGDEYPGQVAILQAVRELQPEQVRGPADPDPGLNLPAAKAATRLSPLDGKNFNRCFPGKPDGTRHRDDRPLPDDRAVSAGRHRHRHPHRRPQHGLLPVRPHAPRARPRAARQMMAGTEAWNTDFAFLYADIAGTGLLPVEAERQGKIVITTEMGGGEIVPAARASAHARAGCATCWSTSACCAGKEKTRPTWACSRRAGCRRSTATTIASRRSPGSTRTASISGKR